MTDEFLTADTHDDLDKMFEDSRCDEVFNKIFNPVYDDTFDIERDDDRFAMVLADLQVLGYSRDASRDYINGCLSECDNAELIESSAKEEAVA